MRCPVCFSREIDVLLLHDGDRYYCVKCSYAGDAAAVREQYAGIKAKYRNRRKRLTADDISVL
jgi:hypothetical protein